MATAIYELVGGVWTCPGRPDITPGSGGGGDTSTYVDTYGDTY